MTQTPGVADEGTDLSFWRTHTQISLQPVAAPSILGLFGFAASTFMVAANLAGWYGDDSTTPLVLFPFATMFGGVAQFLAGMWSYRARDGLATAMHGMWGSFWLAYGLYFLLVGMHTLPAPSASHAAQVAFGYWFIVLAAITWAGMAAAAAESSVVATVLGFLAAGSTIAAIGELAGVEALRMFAGWLFIISAIIAWYAATALMINAAYRRNVLRLGARPKPDEIQFGIGEPGVLRGQ